MGDISLCHGTDCLKRDTCLRFTQPARAKWQSYLIMKVSIKDTEACRFFIENKLDEQS